MQSNEADIGQPKEKREDDMAKLTNIRERVQQPFRDSLVRTAGLTAGTVSDRNDLFVQANNAKTDGETNLKNGNTLPSDQSMIILALRVFLWFRNSILRGAYTAPDSPDANGDVGVFPNAAGDAGVGNALGNKEDVYRLYWQAAEQLFWTFGAGSKPSIESMPSVYFPYGGGIVGDIGNASDFVNLYNGDATHQAILKLARAILLVPRQAITCQAAIQALSANGQATTFETTQDSRNMLSLTSNLNAIDGIQKVISFSFDGLLSRDVQLAAAALGPRKPATHVANRDPSGEVRTASPDGVELRARNRPCGRVQEGSDHDAARSPAAFPAARRAHAQALRGLRGPEEGQRADEAPPSRPGYGPEGAGEREALRLRGRGQGPAERPDGEACRWRGGPDLGHPRQADPLRLPRGHPDPGWRHERGLEHAVRDDGRSLRRDGACRDRPLGLLVPVHASPGARRHGGAVSGPVLRSVPPGPLRRGRQRRHGRVGAAEHVPDAVLGRGDRQRGPHGHPRREPDGRAGSLRRGWDGRIARPDEHDPQLSGERSAAERIARVDGVFALDAARRDHHGGRAGRELQAQQHRRSVGVLDDAVQLALGPRGLRRVRSRRDHLDRRHADAPEQPGVRQHLRAHAPQRRVQLHGDWRGDGRLDLGPVSGGQLRWRLPVHRRPVRCPRGHQRRVDLRGHDRHHGPRRPRGGLVPDDRVQGLQDHPVAADAGAVRGNGMSQRAPMPRQPGSPGGNPADPRTASTVGHASRPGPYGVPAAQQGRPAVQLPGGWPTSANAYEPQPARQQVIPPLGSLFDRMLHPIFKAPWERVFRTQPNASFHAPNRSPGNPYFATMGEFKVPQGQALYLQEMNFSAAKPTGSASSDTVLIERERGSTLWGFDINIDGVRDRQTEYELDPVPAAGSDSASFAGNSDGRVPSATYFARGKANQFGLASGPGRATLPFRPGRYGPKEGPFTLRVPPGGTLIVTCCVFRPIPFPLAYVEATLSGYFLPSTLMEKFDREMTPLRIPFARYASVRSAPLTPKKVDRFPNGAGCTWRREWEAGKTRT